MKQLLLIFILLPFAAFSQKSTKELVFSEGVQDSIFDTSIILKNNTVIFQKVYDSSLDVEELTSKLRAFLPSIKSFQLTESSNQQQLQFSGRLTDFNINYKKYGGSLMGTAIVLNYPVNASVIIQVKDKKYRVIISDILFKNVKILPGEPGTDMLLDDFATKKKRTLFNGNSIVVKGLKYINNDFSESFDLKSPPKISENF